MTQAVIVGIDLGRNWFHLIGVDGAGATVFRKKMNRSQLTQFAATHPGASWQPSRARVRSTGAGCLQKQATRSGLCRRNS